MLTVENLEVCYGDVRALDGVSLEVAEGAIVAIVGANGAGKTTLIRTIAGMLRPLRGGITLRGASIAGLPSHRVCNLGIGQVAEGRQVFPTLTVLENLEMGAMLPRARADQAQNLERVFALFPKLAERTGQAADAGVPQHDAAPRRAKHAGDGADERGLAGAVGADDRHDGALRHFERNAVERPDVAVGHFEVLDGEHYTASAPR